MMAKAKGPTYVVNFRRRRENVTDYRARINMLKSGLPRLVLRKSNRGIQAELVEFHENGDRVIARAYSSELKAYGWLPKCNTPTAYLIGLLLAKKSGGKTNQAILDIGRYSATKNNIAFATAKAMNDAGIQCPLGQDMISEDRITGKHIASYAASLSEEKFSKMFSEYIKAKVDVKNLPTVFEHAKQSITKQ